MSPKTIRDFFADDQAPLGMLVELLAERTPVGDDWEKQDLVNLTDLFSGTLDESIDVVDSSLLIEIMEQLALSGNGQLLRRLQTVMAVGIGEFAKHYKDIKLEPRRYNNLMSLLNALGENEDQRHQVKLLESLLNKWLVERQVSGRNESIFCITLLSQYDMLCCDSRENMSTKARQALNSAIVAGNMNYNVQLYAKILLENQVQSTAQHLRINEVNYESGTASQFEGVKDGVVGFSEHSDYLFIFGSFPNQPHIQVIHESEVSQTRITRHNDAIHLAVNCETVKYSLVIPIRDTDANFGRRMGDLATFLKEDVWSGPHRAKVANAQKKGRSRCARSDIDLHIHFDEEKSQNGKNGEPTQEEFFSPQEELLLEEEEEAEKQKPKKILRKKQTPIKYRITESPATSDYSHIRPSVSVRPNYDDASFIENTATIEASNEKRTFNPPQTKKPIKRKQRKQVEEEDVDYEPCERKRPTRKAAAVAMESVNLIAKNDGHKIKDSVSLSQVSHAGPSATREKRGRKLAKKKQTVSKPVPMDEEEEEADALPSISISTPKVPPLTDETLKRRQSDLFDRVCDKSTNSLPKPSSLAKKKFQKETPSEVVTPVEILKSFSSLQNAPKRQENGPSKIIPPSKVTLNENGVTVANDGQIEQAIKELIRQSPGNKPLTVNIFKSGASIEAKTAELKAERQELEKLQKEFKSVLESRDKLRQQVLDIVATFK